MDKKEIEKFMNNSSNSDKIVIFFVEGVYDYEFNDDLFEFLTKKYKSGIYLTARFTARELYERLELTENELNKIMFVDCISSKKNARQIKNAIYISEQNSLYEISEKINNLLNTGKYNFLFSDSMWNLSNDNDLLEVIRFLRYLKSKLEERGIEISIFSVKNQSGANLFDAAKLKYKQIMVN